jgi:hypothetical protein
MKMIEISRRPRFKHWCGALGVFVLCCVSFAARAQMTTADVVGTVTDVTGAVVPGAKVTLTNLRTGVVVQTQSNEAGDYVFNLLTPSQYSVSIGARGFKTFVISEVSLAAGDRTRENGLMQTGSIQEEVKVTAATPLLETDTSAVSNVVTEHSVQDLPLNGRNYVNLVTLLPGVSAGPPDAVSSGERPDDRRQATTVSANGESDYYNNEMVDGMDNNERLNGFVIVRPSIDAIAELNVATNLYSAEFGRNAGAVINIITKSGTNDYHGSAYEFWRNDILDARSYFAQAGVTHKPEYRQNQFGGSIGGPIVKDKTFFFGDVEDLRIVQGQSSGTLTVPTLYEEQHPGDFSDVNGPVVPTASLDPVGLAYFKMYPAPNIPGAGSVNNYTSAPNETQNALSLDGRIDQHFHNGDSLYGRYSYNNVHTVVGTPFPAVSIDGRTISPGGGNYGFFGPSTTKAHGFQLDYIHIFTPNLVLNLKAGFVRLDTETFNPNTGDVSSAIGLVNVNTPIAPQTGGLMPVNFTGGYTDLGDSPYDPILNIQNNLQYVGAVTYTHKAHNIKMGSGIIRRQINFFQSAYPLGYVNFSDKTGNSLEDLLTGQPIGYQRANLLIKPGYRGWEYNAYIQDDWRATRSLTLNLGVRYEIFTAFTEAHNRYANFDYPTLTLISGSTSPSIGVNTAYNKVSPRIGFAQSLGKNTVVRGGYGITYYPTTADINIGNPPYQYANTCSPCAPFWPVLPNPTPSSTTDLSGSLTYVAPNNSGQTFQQYNLLVQHELGANVFTLGYVGGAATHLFFNPSINIPNPNGPYPDDAINGPPPTQPLLTAAKLPNVSLVTAWLPEGVFNYNSMQAVFARRLTHGLVFNANYTWAHGLGDTENATQGASVNGLIPSDPRYDYGNSGIDIRSRFAMTLSYALPFGREAVGAKALLIKGWTANFIDYWQTGLPFTVSDGVTNANGVAQINLPDTGGDRPDVIPGERLTVPHPSIKEWFNVSAFTPQPAGTPGDERNNQLRGPHTRRADLSLFKSIDLTEKYALQFRAECYNISNTPNFSAPNAGISNYDPGPAHGASNPISTVGLLPGDISTNAGGFGTISSTVSGVNPRQFQFALKVLF